MLRKVILLHTTATLLFSGCVSHNPTIVSTSTPTKEIAQTKTVEHKTGIETLTVLPQPGDEIENGVEKTPLELEISTPDDLSQPSDENMRIEGVYIDLAEIVQPKVPGNLITVHISGSLPTPCNQLCVEIYPPNENNIITITAYSIVETESVCAQVLTPFDEYVDTEPLPSGTYSVRLNDDPLGEVTVP